jgi:hypothetical protein
MAQHRTIARLGEVAHQGSRHHAVVACRYMGLDIVMFKFATSEDN